MALVSKITGLAHSTINRGEDDLDTEPLAKGRVRRAGGGRRAVSETDSGLVPALQRLQKLADETGLVIHVHHYPPGTSKWNKIEHRLFCDITQNWRGRPLTTRLAVIELIGATTTKTGLKVDSALDTRTYATASGSARPR